MFINVKIVLRSRYYFYVVDGEIEVLRGVVICFNLYGYKVMGLGFKFSFFLVF